MTVVIDRKLSTGQAARALGVSEQPVRVWTRSRRLRAEQTPLGARNDPVEIGRASDG